MTTRNEAMAIALFGVLFSPAAAGAQAVRCVDQSGHVYYGSQVPTGVKCVSESGVAMPKQPDASTAKQPSEGAKTGGPDRLVLGRLGRTNPPTIAKVYDSEAECQAGVREVFEEWKAAPESARSGIAATCLPVGVNPQ
jgi:hypothetical protein